MTIRLAVTLDTECDKGPRWALRRPLSFRNIREGVAGRLEPLFARYAVKPTYLLSPEILHDDASVAYFAGLGPGAELGAHLHAEFIEPFSEPETERTDAFQSDYPPRVEFEKLANLTALFERRLGHRPTAFRAGRYGISRHTLGFLEELGYRVDSSVTPHTWWRRSARRGVNFFGAPDQPYHPSRRDFRRPGRMAILEVPITLVNPFWDRWPRAVRRSLDPFHRWQTLALRTVFKRRLRSSWLRPSFTGTQEMLQATDYLARRARGSDVVLCMMFHSSEAAADTSPYHATDAEADGFVGRLERYFEGLFDRFDVAPIGLSEATEVAPT